MTSVAKVLAVLRLLAMVVVPALGSTFYDQPFTFSCNNNQFLSGLKSHHDNHKEDRSWDFTCKNLPDTAKKALLGRCAWSDYTNDFDGPMSFLCPPNKIITGISSINDNRKEDRRYNFLCCNAGDMVAQDCSLSMYQNSFDNELIYNVPSDRVLTGVFSIHNNKYEDRRFQFETCRLHESHLG